MQRRLLNYRPTWDLQANYNDSLQNITANFYPVNSAIVVKDSVSSKQISVLNDRSQAATALENGQAQFMQNRRIPADDSRGMGEPVNETDAFGHGIRVPATYYVQLFDTKVERSVQRLVQQKIEEPAQYFFNFNQLKASKTQIPSTFSADLKAAGVKGTVKLVSFPLDQNKVLLRLINIADLIDHPVEPHTVDINAVSMALFKEANRGSSDSSCQPSFQEMALTGNMKIEEMLSRKI